MRALVLAALLLAVPARGAARFAVVVGNDQGSAGRPKLWFAEKDAERFARALEELGDFSPDRVVLVRGGGAGRMREALAATEAKMALVRSAGERPLLVVYFSGHAGAGGLELGTDRMAFDELRGLVAGSVAEARVVIVDACEAGLLTQVKGATAAPALDFPLPVDESVRGTAFVASTAVGEAAQESASIGGSFFTHHLEVAMRGAGDADGDGLVTLAEAFRYTSARTLSGTAVTEAGPQHATYDFKMSGRGDIVLADLRRAEARLTLPPDPGSQYVLRGPHSIVAEVTGGPTPVTLALPAGRYTVERRSPEGRATGTVTLERGVDAQLPSLTPTRYEQARAKGGPKPGLIYAGAGIGYVALPDFGPGLSVVLGLRKEVGPVGLRLRLNYLGASVTDQSLQYSYLSFDATLAALFPLTLSPILVEVGPELGLGYANQTLPNAQSFSSAVLIAGLAVLITAPLGPVRVGLDGSVDVQGFTLNNDATVRFAGSAQLVVLYDF